MFSRIARILPMIAASVAGFATALPAAAAVPVRISVKFVLDSNGNRPATGDVNQDADVEDQVDRANAILADLGSEHRVELVEIVDLDDAAQFYASPIGTSSRDAVRNAATADPARYAWRDDAVNFYVNGSTGSAIADFPSDNDVVLVGQGIFDTTFLHELGHILDLFHTHETNGGGDGDSCNDTITDMASWTWADIAENSFGERTRSQLAASEAAQVDAVWDNVMSYHDGDNRSFLTRCQMDRKSAQGWRDRDWMLARRPVYVDPNAGAGGNSGSWGNPFANLDEAVGAGGLGGRTLVLLAGAHTASVDLSTGDVDVVARRGTATIRRDISPWDDRVDPARSDDPAVAEAMRAVQAADRAGDAEAALEALLRGEAAARGADRIAIRLELGERLRHAGRLDAAIERYERVAEAAAASGDEKLRKHVRYEVGRIEDLKRSNARGPVERESSAPIGPPSDGSAGRPGAERGPSVAPRPAAARTSLLPGAGSRDPGALDAARLANASRAPRPSATRASARQPGDMPQDDASPAPRPPSPGARRVSGGAHRWMALAGGVCAALVAAAGARLRRSRRR